MCTCKRSFHNGERDHLRKWYNIISLALISSIGCWIILKFHADTIERSSEVEVEARKDMPYSMASSIQAIVIGDNVYVGGGATPDENNCTVMVCSLTSGSWSTLPPHETKWFGMIWPQ